MLTYNRGNSKRAEAGQMMSGKMVSRSTHVQLGLNRIINYQNASQYGLGTS